MVDRKNVTFDAAGIFIPTMAIGGAVGRLAGRGVQAALTAAGVDQQVRRRCAAAGRRGLPRRPPLKQPSHRC